MRGSFNTTADFFGGPGSATPGLFLGTFPCRFVITDGIFLDGDGSPLNSAYITLDGYLPIGAWTVPEFGMDPRLSDQVAVPSGSAVLWWVLWAEHVVWHAGPPYFRGVLAPLPLPSTAPPPALALVGAGIASANMVLAPSYSHIGAITLFSWAIPAQGLVVASVLPARGGLALAIAAPVEWPLVLSAGLPPAEDLVLSAELPPAGPLVLNALPDPAAFHVLLLLSDVSPAVDVVLSAELPPASSLILSAELPPLEGLVLSAELPPAGPLVLSAGLPPAEDLVLSAELPPAGGLALS